MRQCASESHHLQKHATCLIRRIGSPSVNARNNNELALFRYDTYELCRSSRCLLPVTPEKDRSCTSMSFRHGSRGLGLSASIARCSAPGPETRGKQDEDRRLRVADLSPLNQLQRVRQRHRFERHEFVSFTLALAPAQPRGNESVNALVDESGRRIKGIERLDTLGG